MLLAFKCPNGQIEPAYTARGVTDQWRSAGGSAHIVTRLERFTPQRLSGCNQACRALFSAAHFGTTCVSQITLGPRRVIEC